MFTTYSNTRNRKDFCRDQFNHKLDKLRDSFFTGKHPLKEAIAEKLSAHRPVNISENKEYFALQLFAAGLKKEQFQISVKNSVLTISYKETERKSDSDYIYQEFYPNSFERSFQLNDKVATENISANYEDGILTVILPKDPENNQPAQEIKIH